MNIEVVSKKNWLAFQEALRRLGLQVETFTHGCVIESKITDATGKKVPQYEADAYKDGRNGRWVYRIHFDGVRP